jgi:hypothetical protein
MNIREVLAEGRRIFLGGLATAFPWILAGELLAVIPGFNNSNGLLDTDIAQLVDPLFLLRMAAFGILQAFLYGMAILRLPPLAGDASDRRWHHALRAAPSMFVAYIAYELLVGAGLVISLLFFVLGDWFLGLGGALLLSLLLLVPTAVASTAFALFAYPAVLEGRRPFAALDDSRRLVMRHWGRASVVISVPALGLLALWLAQNAESLFKTLPESLSQLSNMSAEASSAELQSLLAGSQSHAAPGLMLQLVLAVAAALVWWYTLAVCYAEYRELAGPKSA